MKGICFLSFLRLYKSTCHFKSVVYDSAAGFLSFFSAEFGLKAWVVCRVWTMSAVFSRECICASLVLNVSTMLMRVFIWSLEWGNFVLFNSNFRHAGAPALRGMLSICWSFNPPLLFTLKYLNCYFMRWVNLSTLYRTTKVSTFDFQAVPHSSIDPFGLFWLGLPG